MQIHIPLEEFTTGSIHAFDSSRTIEVLFGQLGPDGAEHTLIIDEIKIDDAASAATGPETAPALSAPQNIAAKAYERHIDVSWDAVTSSHLQRYVIYHSRDGQNFQPAGIQVPGVNRFTDYLGKVGETAYYKVAAADRQYRLSPFSHAVNATTRPMSDDELLTMLQEACFRYYWEGAHPISGTALENIPGDDRMLPRAPAASESWR